MLFDMELPVLIEVAGKIDSSELDDSFGHLRGPAHAGTFHAVPDQIFARAFDRATGDRPAVGKVFVVAHAGAVPVKVTGNCLQSFASGSRESAFGDTLTEALDHLAHIA